jgi:hypothetical protein
MRRFMAHGHGWFHCLAEGILMFKGSIIDELIATVTRIEEQESLRNMGVPELNDDLLLLANFDGSGQTLLSGVA